MDSLIFVGNLYLSLCVGLGMFIMYFLTYSKNAVFCAFFLILLFVNSAFMVLVFGKYFFGMLYILIYVGAVAVIFVYMTMLLDLTAGDTQEDIDAKNREDEEYYKKIHPANDLAVAGVLFYLVSIISLVIFDIFLHGYKSMAGEAYIASSWDAQESTISCLGFCIYILFPYGFILVAMILCVSLVGVLALLLQSRKSLRRQERAKQRLRLYKTAIIKVGHFYHKKGNKKV